tara:strand:- start:865 stop:1335 length:471 start_codon:yes stop_codon:yes gene_type:complete
MSQLKVNSIIPVAGVPTGGGGGVTQVQKNATISTFSTNSTSYADITNCTLNITPSSSSNLYIATFSANIVTALASSHNQQTRLKMFIDSTQIGGDSTYAAESSSGSLQFRGAANMRAVGTFGTTNQVTFKMTAATAVTQSTVYIYQPTLIVMEVSA